MGKRNCVTRPASSLVSQWIGKIEPINVPEVIGFWNQLVRDVISTLVGLSPFLGLREGSLEVRATFCAEQLALGLLLLRVGNSLG